MPENNHAKTAWAPKRLSLIALIFVVFIGVFWLKDTNFHNQACPLNPQLERTKLQVGDSQFKAEIAVNDSDRQQGLSDRKCLDRDRAMLFVYDNPGSNRCFWMKEMQFAIDMVWLNTDKQVVTIKDSVEPSTYPETFCPDGQTQFVVEFNAGVAKKLGWHIGTQFSF